MYSTCPYVHCQWLRTCPLSVAPHVSTVSGFARVHYQWLRTCPLSVAPHVSTVSGPAHVHCQWLCTCSMDIPLPAIYTVAYPKTPAQLLPEFFLSKDQVTNFHLTNIILYKSPKEYIKRCHAGAPRWPWN